jgi:LemA protein
MLPLMIVAALAVALFLALLGIYNRLVAGRNFFKNAFAQIDVQLKRRNDLIPNLVETAKGYIKHERETLEAVTAARNHAVDASTLASASPGDPAAMKGLMQAEGALTGALGKLMAVVEAYPDLKANQSMNEVMEELTSTENRIAFARQAFNDAVTAYNIDRERFPNIVIANSFGFQAAQLLEPIEAAAERQAPKVSF